MEKRIIIDAAHAEKINAAIAAAQGRATARTIDAQRVIDTCADVLRRYTSQGVKKKSLDGLRVRVDVHAQNFPQAYRYNPESTFFDAEYTRGKWYLTDVWRDYTRRAGHGVQVTLTDASNAAILAAMTEY